MTISSKYFMELKNGTNLLLGATNANRSVVGVVHERVIWFRHVSHTRSMLAINIDIVCMCGMVNGSRYSKAFNHLHR